MLCTNAFRNFTRLAGRRTMSAGVPMEDAAVNTGLGALLMGVGTTFGTYMFADFLSNFIQHPTQKMDYGYFNTFLNRPVDRNFWGTRMEHIVGVAGCLAITDHASQNILAKYLGRPLCFAKSPATFIAHTFFFIFTGVTMYVGIDAVYNPDLEGRRIQAFREGTYASAVGSCTAWFEPYVSPTLARVAGTTIAGSWVGSSLLPATLAYITVKGCGWNDWGNSGLMTMNFVLTDWPRSK